MKPLPLCRDRSKSARPDGKHRCASRQVKKEWVEERECSGCLFHDNGPFGINTVRAAAKKAAAIIEAKQPKTPKRPPLASCVYHGEKVTAENERAKTRECLACGQKTGGKMTKQVVFRCTHPQQPMGAEVIIADCAKCPFKP